MDYHVLWASRLLWNFVDSGFKGFEIITTLTGKKNSKNLIIPKNNNFLGGKPNKNMDLETN